MRHLAKRAEVSPAVISLVLSAKQKPGIELCKGLARAFKVPPEQVMRTAGLLPAIHGNEGVVELMEVARSLTPDNRHQVTRIARLMLREQQEPYQTGSIK